MTTQNKPFVVGVTGGSGSGKTSLLNKLIKRVDEGQICLFSQDNYYRDNNEQPEDKNGVKNFDTLSSIDIEQYIEDLKALKQGQTVRRKEYTFNNSEVEAQDLVFSPSKIILAEGIFIFHHPELMQELDLKIFIEVPEAIRLKRRILRDNKERGYDLQDVLYRYEHHVLPAYANYIAPYRQKADLMIPNGADFEKAIEVLVPFFKEKL